MHTLTRAAINRLTDNPGLDLTTALASAHVFRLASGRLLMSALERIIPAQDWGITRGQDAIAALELADP